MLSFVNERIPFEPRRSSCSLGRVSDHCDGPRDASSAVAAAAATATEVPSGGSGARLQVVATSAALPFESIEKQ